MSVEGTGPEEPVRPDDAPEDTAVEMHAGQRAIEAIHGLRGTNTLDVDKHPIQNSDLCKTRYKRSDDLNVEQDFGGYLGLKDINIERKGDSGEENVGNSPSCNVPASNRKRT